MTIDAKVFVSAILLITPHFGAYSDSLEDKLLVCRAITIDDERLNCLDNTIAVLQSVKPTANESEAVHKLQVDTSAELGKKYLQDKDDEVNKEQVFNLINAYKGAKNRWVFEFENGQKWQQNEARYLPSPKPQMYPVKVTISEGVFGAYKLRSDYLNKSVKVKRIL